MTLARLRLALAILAILLGMAAAVVKTPAPHGRASAKPALYRPPGGC